MVARAMRSLLLLASLTTSVLAQAACGNGAKCPLDAPCCSQYGQCGVGAYCLAGCDPVNSASLDACVPQPVCRSGTFNFENLNRVTPNTKYLGDSSKSDWVSSGQPLEYNGNLLLTMAQGTVGTLLTSTFAVWYGKVTAKFSTSAGPGVVTAFILLGDSKDEIDFEFVGVELDIAQTNFYSQGVTNYNNGQNITGLSDVNENMHTYEIDWQPDTITWSIDGKSVRTLNREDTFNATAGRYFFPQTPAPVQLSLWPAGLPSNGQGTIDWAGGLVDWQSNYTTNGYFYAEFAEVEVQCYDPPPGAMVNGSKSYVYTDAALTNNTVEITDNPTVLSTFLGTGLNLTAGAQPKASGTASASGSAKTSEVATIPGLTGAGPGANGQRGSSGDDSSGSAASSASGDSGSGAASATGAASTGFVQGDGGSGSGSSGAGQIGGNSENVLRGSILAVVVAVVGLCVL